MLIVILTLAIGWLSWQGDPVQTLPDVYTLQFENAWVKIVRVRYPPKTTLPAHDHPPVATVYVYLNDAGPVVFQHSGRGSVTRPATRAGAFRLFRANQEEHAVENPGDTASEFLRVQFKTEPKNPTSLRGRFFREEVAAGENAERKQFENEQIRVTRLTCASGRILRVATSAAEPSLLIALRPAELEVTRGSAPTAALALAPGQERWVPAGETDVFANRGGEAAELLRFDLKTKPME